jgi:hypothetical protein
MLSTIIWAGKKGKKTSKTLNLKSETIYKNLDSNSEFSIQFTRYFCQKKHVLCAQRRFFHHFNSNQEAIKAIGR